MTQLLRYVQRRGRGILPAIAVNYIVATVVSAAVLAFYWRGIDWSTHWLAAVLGVVCGVLYFLHLLIVLAGYRLAGVGVTWAFAALGIVLPVFISWSAWGEAMSRFQWAALAMLPVAVVLMRPPGRHQRLTVKGDLVLVLAFLMAGAIGTLHKALNVYVADNPRPVYQAVLFATAAATAAVYVHFIRHRYDRPAVARGALMGVANASATLFILLGLAVVPATVFYPVSSSLVIGVSVIVSYLLWRERLNARQVIGLLVAIAVVVLANL